MTAAFNALRSLVYAAGFIYLWAWIALGVRGFDGNLGVSLPDWTTPLGFVAIGVGGVLALLCVGYFVVRGSGTPAPFDAPSEFVAVGPYRFVRNPMYIGGFIMLIGLALCINSVSVLVFSLIWLLLAHLFVVLYEEPNLERKFGESYVQYKRSVNRWVPRFRTHFQ
jgi:protein-S-isoprenylcysteine O-methyltransferase Ste14